jgi:hypothetical protein
MINSIPTSIEELEMRFPGSRADIMTSIGLHDTHVRHELLYSDSLSEDDHAPLGGMAVEECIGRIVQKIMIAARFAHKNGRPLHDSCTCECNWYHVLQAIINVRFFERRMLFPVPTAGREDCALASVGYSEMNSVHIAHNHVCHKRAYW